MKRKKKPVPLCGVCTEWNVKTGSCYVAEIRGTPALRYPREECNLYTDDGRLHFERAIAGVGLKRRGEP